MIRFLSIIAILTILAPGFAQMPSPKKANLRQIFDSLESGNCEQAYAQSVAEMEDKDIAPAMKSKLLGLRVTGLAQMFITSKISFEDFKIHAHKIPLGPIELIGHKYRIAGGLNSITTEKENPSNLFLAETNKDGTYIYTMFTIKLRADHPFTPIEGAVYFISGNLASISCHPYGRGTYAFKATIENAIVNGQ